MLSDDGVFHRAVVSIEALGSADTQLRALAADVQVFVPRCFATPDGPVHLASGPRTVTLFCRLPNFKIDTFYATASEGKVTPVFARNPGAIQMAPTFQPPDNMVIWFVSVFDIGSNGRCIYNRSNLAITSTDQNVKGAFKLPLPNVYGTGKLCLGSSTVVATIQPNSDQPVHQTFLNALEVFKRSRWNADLLHENRAEHTASMFTFDASTGVSVDVPRNWHTFLIKISNADFNGLPLQNPHYL